MSSSASNKPQKVRVRKERPDGTTNNTTSSTSSTSTTPTIPTAPIVAMAKAGVASTSLVAPPSPKAKAATLREFSPRGAAPSAIDRPLIGAQRFAASPTRVVATNTTSTDSVDDLAAVVHKKKHHHSGARPGSVQLPPQLPQSMSADSVAVNPLISPRYKAPMPPQKPKSALAESADPSITAPTDTADDVASASTDDDDELAVDATAPSLPSAADAVAPDDAAADDAETAESVEARRERRRKFRQKAKAMERESHTKSSKKSSSSSSSSAAAATAAVTAVAPAVPPTATRAGDDDATHSANDDEEDEDAIVPDLSPVDVTFKPHPTPLKSILVKTPSGKVRAKLQFSPDVIRRERARQFAEKAKTNVKQIKLAQRTELLRMRLLKITDADVPDAEGPPPPLPPSAHPVPDATAPVLPVSKTPTPVVAAAAAAGAAAKSSAPPLPTSPPRVPPPPAGAPPPPAAEPGAKSLNVSGTVRPPPPPPVSAAVSKASAVHSTLVLPGDRTSQGVLALRVDAPLNLTVKLRDANGASCDFCASDALNCSLIEDGNGAAVSQPLTPGAHSDEALVTVVRDRRGRFVLRITIDGVDVQGSPAECICQPAPPPPAAAPVSTTVDSDEPLPPPDAHAPALVKSLTPPPTIDLSQFGALTKEAWSGAPEWATAMRNDFLHVIEQLAAQYKSDARGDETIAALATAIAERDLALAYLRHSNGSSGNGGARAAVAPAAAPGATKNNDESKESASAREAAATANAVVNGAAAAQRKTHVVGFVAPNYAVPKRTASNILMQMVAEADAKSK